MVVTISCEVLSMSRVFQFILVVQMFIILSLDSFFQELDLYIFTPPSVSWARCWMSWLFSGFWCVLLLCGSLEDTSPEFFEMTGNHTMVHVQCRRPRFLKCLMLTSKPAHNGTKLSTLLLWLLFFLTPFSSSCLYFIQPILFKIPESAVAASRICVL